LLASYSPVTETLLAPLGEIQFFLVDDKKVLNTKDLEWLKQNLPANKSPELENTEEKENTVLAIQPSKKKVTRAKNVRITINYLNILDAMFI